VRWRSFCGEHDKDAVRPHLAALIGPCMPGGRRREVIRHDDLITLALTDMPPQSLRLGLLELAGLTTAQALDKLGVSRTNRYRVVSELRQRRRS
jgi:hypothetical protein